MFLNIYYVLFNQSFELEDKIFLLPIIQLHNLLEYFLSKLILFYLHNVFFL